MNDPLVTKQSHTTDPAPAEPRRDPRVDPHIGDEIGSEFPMPLAVYGYVFREVTRAHGGFVFYLHGNGHYKKPRIVTLDE